MGTNFIYLKFFYGSKFGPGRDGWTQISPDSAQNIFVYKNCKLFLFKLKEVFGPWKDGWSHLFRSLLIPRKIYLSMKIAKYFCSNCKKYLVHGRMVGLICSAVGSLLIPCWPGEVEKIPDKVTHFQFSNFELKDGINVTFSQFYIRGTSIQSNHFLFE